MQRFKFRLQTLLDQRKAREEKLLWELGEQRRDEAHEMQRLSVLEHKLEDSCNAMELALRENASMHEIARRDDFTKATRDDIRVQHLTIEAVRKRVEAKRVEVVHAIQDRKVLDALRDKQEREYLLEMARQEQNQLDEMASVRYARGM